LLLARGPGVEQCFVQVRSLAPCCHAELGARSFSPKGVLSEVLPGKEDFFGQQQIIVNVINAARYGTADRKAGREEVFSRLDFFGIDHSPVVLGSSYDTGRMGQIYFW